MTFTLLHNPRCSKSRQTLALLEERGIRFEIREYLKDPLSATELEGLVEALGIGPSALIRFKESIAGELGISARDEKSDGEWLSIIAEHPVLMERPVLWAGGRARIGRPPENVLELCTGNLWENK